ncbi:hypothetical protein BVRB_7g174300 [Beta vulgaris subsp. vulgaris]|nr:hypothetical protein BVRB_7g174300 [Beta vulgaris subsp. vulgaris]
MDDGVELFAEENDNELPDKAQERELKDHKTEMIYW